MAGIRIAATSGPPLLLAVLSLLPGVVGNKVGYAEEGAKEGEEGNGRGVMGPLPLLLLLLSSASSLLFTATCLLMLFSPLLFLAL